MSNRLDRLRDRLRSHFYFPSLRALKARDVLREILLLVVTLGAYFAARVLVRGSGAEPMHNSFDLFRFEYFVNLDWEIALQRAVVHNSHLAVHVFNFIYAYGYWLILATTFVYLYIRHGTVYRILRNAILISGLVGFFIFATYPVAPPRLAPVGIIDTVELSSSVLEEVARPSGLTNENAAMPSFHFGWILLCGICLSMTLRRRTGKALALALPLVMGVTIIVTGNHYVIDAIVGGLLCLVCFVPWRIQLRHAQRPSQRVQQA